MDGPKSDNGMNAIRESGGETETMANMFMMDLLLAAQIRWIEFVPILVVRYAGLLRKRPVFKQHCQNPVKVNRWAEAYDQLTNLA